MFTFSHHPTAIGVSDGIQDAFGYLQKSWRTWLPVVGVIAACALVTHALVGSLDTTTLYHQDSVTGRLIWNGDAWSRLTSAIGARLVDAILSVIGSWVFYATAIAGLRNRPVTVTGVIAGGLVTVLSGFVIAAVVILAFAGLAAVAITAVVAARGVGVLVIVLMGFAAIPAAIYFAVRLVFTSVAIFDGFGPIGGIRESWRLSQGSVQRLLGWGALALLMTLGIGIMASVIAAPFLGSRIAAIAEAVSAGITLTGSGLVVFMMAVLYESERARKDPTLYPVPAWPGYGPNPYEPYGPGPYPARPYAPGPYTAGPYAGGPYQPGPYAPADPTAIPGWVDPNGPAPAWPAGPYGQGQYPANPSAVPGWVAPGPAQAWPQAPYATGPYPANPAAASGWVAPGPAPAWAVKPANPAGPAPENPTVPDASTTSPAASSETDHTQEPPEAPAS